MTKTSDSGASMNYDSGPKRHWRRWVWNRITERVVSPRDALVLYLAGLHDFDRAIAKTRGFHDNNLIAIERDKSTREHLRQNGVLTIDANLFDAVLPAATNRHIDVVFADLCSGLTAHVVRSLVLWMFVPTMFDCVFVFNMLRGRDAESNRLRSYMKDGATHEEHYKHRGWVLFNIMVGRAIKCTETIELTDQLYESASMRVWDLSNPAFHSYRSTSNQTFDTLVFRNPIGGCVVSDENRNRAWNEMKKSVARNGLNKTPTYRATAAIMAHRTMRNNGK